MEVSRIDMKMNCALQSDNFSVCRELHGQIKTLEDKLTLQSASTQPHDPFRGLSKINIDLVGVKRLYEMLNLDASH